MTLPNYLKLEHKFAELMYFIKENSISLDVNKCQQYIKQLEEEIVECDVELRPHIPLKKKYLNPLLRIYKKDGDYKQSALSWIESGKPYSLEGDQLLRWDFVMPNLNNPGVLRNYLLTLGWKPREDADRWNYRQIKTKYGKMVKVKDANGSYIRTTPKLPKEDWELDELLGISEQFKVVATREKLKHRYNTIRGYVRNSQDGKISMDINPCGCNTMRVKHKVVANIPRKTSYFGPEMRGLFRASEGKVFVGADVDGLEACCLANLLGDQEFCQFIKDNEYKYHKFFQKVLDKFITGYDAVKAFDFAFIYGGGDEKLGSLCNAIQGNNKVIGAKAREHVSKNVPGLDKLQSRLNNEFVKTQGVTSVDGRWLPVRKKNALINTVCQGDGAIISKYWTVKVCHELDKADIQYKLVVYYHDEIIIECDEKDARHVGEIMVQSIRYVSKYLKLNLELSATYKIGNTWGDIH